MELSWPMKLRIAAAAGVGVVLIGIVGWPLAVPTDPFGAVLAGNVGFSGAIGLAPGLTEAKSPGWQCPQGWPSGP